MTRSIAAPAIARPVGLSSVPPIPASQSPAGLRVVMVVANDVTRDSRVLREAAALAEAGHRVTVLGIMTARTDAPAMELRDGFVIRRLPFRARPPGWWIPPDFYARVAARADRQFRLHRARMRGWARTIGRQQRFLAARVGRLPYHADRAARLARSDVIRLRTGRLGRAWTERLRLAPLTIPGMRFPRPLWRRSRRGRGWGARRHRRELRGFLQRARRTPLLGWPGKVRRLGLRVSTHAARSTVDAARRAARSVAVARVSARRVALRRPRVRALAATTTFITRVGARRAGNGLHRRVSETGSRIGAAGRVIGRGLSAWAGIVSMLVWGTAYLAANRASHGAIEWLTGWRWRWLGWARYVAEHTPDADVWHGHDLTSLPAIVALKRSRGGIAVYDSHEIYLESGRHAAQPRWAKARLERLERKMAAEVDAVVTVNGSLATILAERLGRPDIEVLYNCPARFDGRGGTSLLRQALALPADVPLLLYHGSLSPKRGLEQLLEAIRLPELAGAHLAFLGFGELAAWLRNEAADASYGGRIHVLDAVPPDELLHWLVGVDVAVAPIQPSTLNHRYSSPNKVFEAIAVGTPVAGSDFPEFRRVIADSPFGALGALFDPARPEAIAAAVRGLLDLSPADREALRQRCRSAARNRWNWETESTALVDLYAGFEAQAHPQPMLQAVGAA